MSDTKDELHSHASNGSDARNPAVLEGKPKSKRNCKYYLVHFWWVWLLILIVIVLIVVLPVVYVAYPKTAQKQVNKSKLNITAMSILNPTPDAFDLKITSVLESHSNFHPDIDGFQAGVYLGGSNTEFLSIPIPKVHATNGAVQQVDERYSLNDTSQDAFVQFATALVKDESLSIKIKGKTHLKQGTLQKTSINYDKTVQLVGFNGLASLTVENISLLLTAQPDHANMAGTVSIPNPTVQTIELGNLSLGLALPESITKATAPMLIGNSSLNNVILHPGPNTFPMRATANQTTLIGLLTKNPALAGSKGLPVLISTLSAVVNGTEIPWITKALAANTVSVSLQIGAALKAAGLGALLSGGG